MFGLTSIEICAGAGGQALGLEQAGFQHAALVEIDHWACETLRMNRPQWNVAETDLTKFDGSKYWNKGIDLLAGGLPCPPFSIAGKQKGQDDERDMFPQMLRLAQEIQPRAILVENVRGLLDPKFEPYRWYVQLELQNLGYEAVWGLLNAADYAVPQLRPRVLMVAMRPELLQHFCWPAPVSSKAPTVGDVLVDLMSANGWEDVYEWTRRAQSIAPTVVGGSKKHGGPDLGPTRARRAWAQLGVDGLGIANDAPEASFRGMPRLTCRMVARLQGFPDSWQFAGGKTAAYRQIGNALPPPLASAVGEQIAAALSQSVRSIAA